MNGAGVHEAPAPEAPSKWRWRLAVAFVAALFCLAAAPDEGRADLLDGGFENGFDGWNFDGVGDALPTITQNVVHSGKGAAKFVLTGSQGRSELILDHGAGTLELGEGAQRWFGFSFRLGSMQWGRPGAHNLFSQFHSDGEGSPNFALSLWDYQGRKGLWSHGKTMGGDRFLAKIYRRKWNDVLISFRASRLGQGYYRLFLNGELVDERKRASLIRRDRSIMYIKVGLYRNGGQIPGLSEVYIDNARLGGTRRQVRP